MILILLGQSRAICNKRLTKTTNLLYHGGEKSEKDDLTEDEKKALKAVVRILQEE